MLELALAAAALAVAAAFQPWAVLRAAPLRAPWIAAVVVLPLLWASQARLPAALPAQLSGACLLVLMFGWPLAIVTLALAAGGAALLAGGGWERSASLAAWSGAVPATLALGIGVAIRRWVPRHVFVYILGRAFVGTAAAAGIAGALRLACAPSLAPGPGEAGVMLTAEWLVSWGEAFMTGALAAVFVAFRPEWLLTWSDARYLPPPRPSSAHVER